MVETLCPKCKEPIYVNPEGSDNPLLWGVRQDCKCTLGKEEMSLIIHEVKYILRHNRYKEALDRIRGVCSQNFPSDSKDWKLSDRFCNYLEANLDDILEYFEEDDN